MDKITLVLNNKITSANEIIRWRYKGQTWRVKKERDRWWELIINALCGACLHSGDWEADGFRHVKITSHRTRLLDKDNAYGGAKGLIDALKRLRLIVDDNPQDADIEIDQVKTKGQECTILEIWGNNK